MLENAFNQEVIDSKTKRRCTFRLQYQGYVGPSSRTSVLMQRLFWQIPPGPMRGEGAVVAGVGLDV